MDCGGEPRRDGKDHSRRPPLPHQIDEADHLANRLILLASGRIIADTTPEGLRSRGGPATVRYRVPEDVVRDDLPAMLPLHMDPESRAMVVRADDPAGPLRELLGWATVDDVGLLAWNRRPPSLKAYLAAIGEPVPADGTLR